MQLRQANDVILMVSASSYLDHRLEYLTPAVSTPGLTCVKCRGTVTPGFLTCYKCGNTYPPEAFPDALGFGIFAKANTQSGTIMRRYKGELHSEEHRTIVLALAMLGIRQALQLFDIDTVTIVPSLSDRIGPHPLRQIVDRAVNKTSKQAAFKDCLAAHNPVANPRGYMPSNFQVSDQGVQNRRILLIDDTWASGGHLLSATNALRQHGALRVYAISLARWLTDGNSYRQTDILERASLGSTSFSTYQFFQL